MGTMTWQVAGGQLDVAIGAAQCSADTLDAAKDPLRVELTGGGLVVTCQFPADADPAISREYDGYRFERQ